MNNRSRCAMSVMMCPSKLVNRACPNSTHLAERFQVCTTVGIGRLLRCRRHGLSFVSWAMGPNAPMKGETMQKQLRVSLLAAALTAGFGLAGAAQAENSPKMTFFVTSVGKGKGADLGGLEGADAHCASLAKAVGTKATEWHAYLST